MAEMRVTIEDAQGQALDMDSSGRITASTVGPVSTDMYTEATTSRTVSGNTSGQFWQASAQQCWVTVNLTALTGGTSPTVTVQLQQLDANSVWHTIGTHTALNAVGTANFSVGVGMTTGAMLKAGSQYRLAWVITGTPATCSFQIAVSGR